MAGKRKSLHGTAEESAQPYIATKRACQSHTAAITVIPGLPEKLGCRPLRLLLVGHNPSEHAWKSGHYYSNPSNKFWTILKKTGIAPDGIRGCQDDDLMPEIAGVGFTDVGSGDPGTDSSKFTTAHFKVWQQSFFRRLREHMVEASTSIGCECGTCGAPCIVAFTGKRHYKELLKIGGVLPKDGKLQVGPQVIKPPGWPLPESTEVWVLTSTSGASALTHTEREAPYLALSQRLQQIPWPRTCTVQCCGTTTATGGGAAEDGLGFVAAAIRPAS